MQLTARLFKEETIDGKYRAHFKVFQVSYGKDGEIIGEQEVSRFGYEYRKKPKDSTIKRVIKQKLKLVSENPPDIPPEPKPRIEVKLDG